MQRTLGDDLKVGAGTFAGVALACLLGPGDATALLVAALSIVVAIAVLTVVRRVRSRRG